MADDLKPCPFCGSKNIEIIKDDDEIPRWSQCLDCVAEGPPIDYRFDGTPEEARKIAIDNWNRRAESEVSND